MLETSLSHRYLFGAFELDESTLTLRRGTQLLPLPTKPWTLLTLLLQHAPRVVRHQDIYDAVWGRRPSGPGMLAQVMNRLRAVFGDDAGTLIRNVRSEGFCIAVDVQKIPITEIKAVGKPPKVGTAVRGRQSWQLRECLSTGAHHSVWLAEHISSRELRVFKFAFDQVGKDQLKREVLATAALADEIQFGFLPVTDWDFSETPYLIEMPHIQPGSLDQILAGTDAQNREEIVRCRVAWMEQLSQTLAQAHDLGIVHGDICAQNVLVSQAGTSLDAFLSDFGSAQLASDLRGRELAFSALGSGAAMNTHVLYAAPELLKGAATTPASDVYALGVLCFQLHCLDSKASFTPGWESKVTDPIWREDLLAMCADVPAHRINAADAYERIRTLELRRLNRKQQDALEVAQDIARKSRTQTRWAIAIAALCFFVMSGFAWIWHVAETRQKEAEAHRSMAEAKTEEARRYQVIAEQTRDTVMRSLINSANPYEGGDPNMPINKVLETTANYVSKSLKHEPDFAIPLLDSIGSVLLMSRRLEASETVYGLANQLAPKASVAVKAIFFLGYGEVLRAREKPAQALPHYLRSAELTSNPRVRLRAFSGAASCLLRQGKAAEALIRLNAAEAITLPSQDRPELLYDSLKLSRADAEIQLQNFKKGEALAAELLERRPVMRPLLLTYLANARSQQNDFTGALDLSNKALAAFDPKIPIGNLDTLRLNQIKYLFLTGKVQVAQQKLNVFIEERNAALGTASQASTFRLKAEITSALGEKTAALASLQLAKTQAELALSKESTFYAELEELERQWTQ